MATGEEYLGDGLYVSFNGESFILRAPRYPDEHWVALDSEVLANFDKYRQRITKEINDERPNQSK